MHHAIHIVGDTNKQTKLGDVFDLAFNFRANRILVSKAVPWIGLALFQPQRDTTLGFINFQHHHFYFLRSGNDFARMNIFLHPRHFRNMNKTFNAFFQLNKCTIIGDIGDLAAEFGANRIFRSNAFPRIRRQLFHAERDAVGFRIDFDDLDLNSVINIQNLRRVIDPTPTHIGHMQQAINARCQLNKCTIIGDVFDNTIARIAFIQVAHDLGTLLGAIFFKNGTARNNNIATTAIHFQNSERLCDIHQRCRIAHRTNIHL